MIARLIEEGCSFDERDVFIIKKFELIEIPTTVGTFRMAINAGTQKTRVELSTYLRNIDKLASYLMYESVGTTRKRRRLLRKKKAIWKERNEKFLPPDQVWVVLIDSWTLNDIITISQQPRDTDVGSQRPRAGRTKRRRQRESSLTRSEETT